MKIVCFIGMLLAATPAFARGGQNPPLASLKTVTLPAPTGLDLYAQDQTGLAVLGKALLWDMHRGVRS